MKQPPPEFFEKWKQRVANAPAWRAKKLRQEFKKELLKFRREA